VRVTAKVDYAVRALVELAAAGSGTPVKAERLAASQTIPLRFLLNILGELKTAKLVESRRGSEGGWAFAWRSLMAGELLVAIANKKSIGTELSFARQLSDAPRLYAVMITILVIGILVSSAFFATVERAICRRWDLNDAEAR